MIEVKYTNKNKKHNIPYNIRALEAYVEEAKGVPFLRFPSYDGLAYVRHGFSTKLGGVSKGEWTSMNLSYTRGDQPDHVDENYRRICQALDMKTENLVLSDQVHDTKVVLVGEEQRQGQDLRQKKLVGIDGLVTKDKGVILSTSYADCVPLFFVDQDHQAIGSSHSGWRGTVGKIGAKTVKKMTEEFATDPKQLLCVIGPSICQSCYEVSQDVYDAFVNFVDAKEIARQQNWEEEKVLHLIDSVFIDKANGKYQLDLWMANKLILLEAGVPQENIAVSCVCTCCNHSWLYSHRASQGRRGNLNGFLELVD